MPEAATGASARSKTSPRMRGKSIAASSGFQCAARWAAVVGWLLAAARTVLRLSTVGESTLGCPWCSIRIFVPLDGERGIGVGLCDAVVKR